MEKMCYWDLWIRESIIRIRLFLSADGQTRIVEIWDQTVPSSTGDGPFGYGTVYTAEQIREAVKLENPLSLVPVTDPEGHGTL